MGPFDRLLHLGNVVVDVVLDVPGLPERGGDTLASRTRLTAGGGFNVMVAAARQGLPVRYAGAHGSGPLAALACAALAEAGIEVVQQPAAGLDTGFVVSLVEPDGERTFITSPGAEAAMTAEGLAGVRATARDAVYLSGYGLMYPGNQRALLGWLGRLGGSTPVFFDPGPLAASIPAAALDLVMQRADWLTCNAREAAALTGRPDPAEALSALASGAPAATGPASGEPANGAPAAGGLGGLRPGRADRPGPAGGPGSAGRPRGVLVRMGRDGCLLGQQGARPVRLPGFPVDAVDTSGAGDTHTGTFIAALAQGRGAADAARAGNAAAALSVTRRGPATAPTATELATFLATGTRQGDDEAPDLRQ
jgi:sugar/nucleoside kinase (ribokinase family)